MKIIILCLSIFLFSCKEDNLSHIIKDYPALACSAQDSLLILAEEKGVKLSSQFHPISSGADFENGIQLSVGMTTEEAWTSLFFESYNLNAKGEFLEIYNEALISHISKRDWVEKNTKIEYNNLQKFAKFAKDTLKPYYIQHGIKPIELEKLLYMSKLPFSSWMSASQDSYPWNYWGKYYDEHLDKRGI